MKSKKEDEFNGNPLEFYKKHYEGVSRGQLQKRDKEKNSKHKNRGIRLYKRLRKEGLLEKIPSTRKDVAKRMKNTGGVLKNNIFSNPKYSPILLYMYQAPMDLFTYGKDLKPFIDEDTWYALKRLLTKQDNRLNLGKLIDDIPHKREKRFNKSSFSSKLIEEFFNFFDKEVVDNVFKSFKPINKFIKITLKKVEDGEKTDGGENKTDKVIINWLKIDRRNKRFTKNKDGLQFLLYFIESTRDFFNSGKYEKNEDFLSQMSYKEMQYDDLQNEFSEKILAPLEALKQKIKDVSQPRRLEVFSVAFNHIDPTPEFMKKYNLSFHSLFILMIVHCLGTGIEFEKLKDNEVAMNYSIFATLYSYLVWNAENELERTFINESKEVTIES